MDKTLVENECIRRQYLSSIIEIYVETNFTLATKSKLKRGQIQKEIGEYYGIVPNNLFCKIVNKIMENKGYVCGTIDGNQYYKFVKRID